MRNRDNDIHEIVNSHNNGISAQSLITHRNLPSPDRRLLVTQSFQQFKMTKTSTCLRGIRFSVSILTLSLWTVQGKVKSNII